MLDRILFDSSRALADTKRKRPLSTFIHHAIDAELPRPFSAALRRPDRIAVIAEIKFRSPSTGELRTTRDVAGIAKQYAAAGADALSVVTETTHFDGHLEYLAEAKAACNLPVLRKDFITDPYQLYESRAAGADAVLLIAPALEPETLSELRALAADLRMSTLIELHDVSDLAKLNGKVTDVIGVNHRNLRTLQIDLDASARLFPMLPSESTRVAESGISSAEQLKRLRGLGAHAALIGTSLMREPSPGDALTALISSCG